VAARPTDYRLGRRVRFRENLEALGRAGVPDYVRVSTRLTAVAAPELIAHRLEIEPGAPLLRADSVNADPDGRVAGACHAGVRRSGRDAGPAAGRFELALSFGRFGNMLAGKL
jgi:hypothetical protein